MNRNTVFDVFVMVATLSYGSVASAELLASAVSKAEAETIEVGAAFVISAVTLDIGGNKRDIDRQMVPVYAAYGVNDMVDVYAGVAMILKAEAENVDDDGDGLGWGGGVRSDLPFGDDFILRGYAQFFYISEEYTNGIEGNGWFVDVGALAMHEVSDELNVYAAIELAPFEDFEAKTSGPRFRNATSDAERDDLLTMRLGAKFDMDTFFLRGEAAFAGERSFTIGAGMTF